ncbi:MAG: tetratricopeptide repeat protein [Sphingobacteriia bacterium]
MNQIKTTIGVLFILFFMNNIQAQNPALIQKAFTDSYLLENKKLYGEAIAALNKVYDENSYAINLRLGWLNYMNKNYAQSQQFYQKAVAKKPQSIEAKLGLVNPLAALDNQEKTLQVYNDIIKLDDANYTANYWAGVIHYNQKRFEQAARFFEKVVNNYPFNFDGNHLLGWTYLKMNKPNEAKLAFNTALLIAPGNASCLDALSKIK